MYYTERDYTIADELTEFNVYLFSSFSAKLVIFFTMEAIINRNLTTFFLIEIYSFVFKFYILFMFMQGTILNSHYWTFYISLYVTPLMIIENSQYISDQ